VNFVEFVRGIGNLVLVMVIAGGVAYVGDRVGHQVGRKRLSLFGIRPRYTSTIIAIGTGMLIALVLSLGAIFASETVKTAFFKLSSINEQISELQSRQRVLEAKVNNGRIIIPVDTLMVPYAQTIEQNISGTERLTTIQEYYANAVHYINATYPRLGLRPYANPPDIDKKLKEAAAEVAAQGLYYRSNVMLSITSDQNLFANDPIHFQLNSTPDVRRFTKGEPIYTLQIPGNSGASVNIAVNELQNAVSAVARQLTIPMPDYLAQAQNVQPLQLIPSPPEMQRMMSKPGSYLLTAYAAEDVYAHTGGIPVIIALTQQPK
jgi:uncharacterized protein (DUF3084 family)